MPEMTPKELFISWFFTPTGESTMILFSPDDLLTEIDNFAGEDADDPDFADFRAEREVVAKWLLTANVGDQHKGIHMTVGVKAMTQAEIDELPEWEGW